MPLAPLTVLLHGFAAAHYARITGAELTRCERRMAGGYVEPARPVTPDEAHAMMARDQLDLSRISCAATHGERPYRGRGPIAIDWPALHAAALVVDAERTATVGRLGYDGITDAFGGTYFPPSYEIAGLAGVVRILVGAQVIRSAAWYSVHRAHRVGAKGPILAVCALRTALALDHLFRALALVGVYVYEPEAQICGVTGYEPSDTVHVTGLRWLAGAAVDDAPLTMGEVSEFLATAVRS